MRTATGILVLSALLAAMAATPARAAAAGATASAPTAKSAKTAKAAPSTPRARKVLPFIANDYTKAVAEARARKVPLFIESWAPW